MSNFEKIPTEESLAEDIWSEISKSYDIMYDCIRSGNSINIVRKIGSKNVINELIEHFSSIEEYEKCHFLSGILEKI